MVMVQQWGERPLSFCISIKHTHIDRVKYAEVWPVCVDDLCEMCLSISWMCVCVCVCVMQQSVSLVETDIKTMSHGEKQRAIVS